MTGSFWSAMPHIVPPTGAKGLNLAASDVAVLNQIMARVYHDGDTECIDRYSEIALRRVWHGGDWWMSSMLHDFGDEDGAGMDAATFARFMDQAGLLAYRRGSASYRKAIRRIALSESIAKTFVKLDRIFL